MEVNQNQQKVQNYNLAFVKSETKQSKSGLGPLFNQQVLDHASNKKCALVAQQIQQYEQKNISISVKIPEYHKHLYRNKGFNLDGEKFNQKLKANHVLPIGLLVKQYNLAFSVKTLTAKHIEFLLLLKDNFGQCCTDFMEGKLSGITGNAITTKLYTGAVNIINNILSNQEPSPEDYNDYAQAFGYWTSNLYLSPAATLQDPGDLRDNYGKLFMGDDVYKAVCNLEKVKAPEDILDLLLDVGYNYSMKGFEPEVWEDGAHIKGTHHDVQSVTSNAANIIRKDNEKLADYVAKLEPYVENMLVALENLVASSNGVLPINNLPEDKQYQPPMLDLANLNSQKDAIGRLEAINKNLQKFSEASEKNQNILVGLRNKMDNKILTFTDLKSSGIKNFQSIKQQEPDVDQLNDDQLKTAENIMAKLSIGSFPKIDVMAAFKLLRFLITHIEKFAESYIKRLTNLGPVSNGLFVREMEYKGLDIEGEIGDPESRDSLNSNEFQIPVNRGSTPYKPAQETSTEPPHRGSAPCKPKPQVSKSSLFGVSNSEFKKPQLESTKPSLGSSYKCCPLKKW